MEAIAACCRVESVARIVVLSAEMYGRAQGVSGSDLEAPGKLAWNESRGYQAQKLSAIQKSSATCCLWACIVAKDFYCAYLCIEAADTASCQ